MVDERLCSRVVDQRETLDLRTPRTNDFDPRRNIGNVAIVEPQDLQALQRWHRLWDHHAILVEDQGLQLVKGPEEGQIRQLILRQVQGDGELGELIGQV